ncbi:MAG: hypothetical protein GXO09_02585 [Crenarchaeota archaeon]|nr:hypothetical protein [Thermoproteota archaeon]
MDAWRLLLIAGVLAVAVVSAAAAAAVAPKPYDYFSMPGPVIVEVKLAKPVARTLYDPFDRVVVGIGSSGSGTVISLYDVFGDYLGYTYPLTGRLTAVSYTPSRGGLLAGFGTDRGEVLVLALNHSLAPLYIHAVEGPVKLLHLTPSHIIVESSYAGSEALYLFDYHGNLLSVYTPGPVSDTAVPVHRLAVPIESIAPVMNYTLPLSSLATGADKVFMLESMPCSLRVKLLFYNTTSNKWQAFSGVKVYLFLAQSALNRVLRLSLTGVTDSNGTLSFPKLLAPLPLNVTAYIEYREPVTGSIVRAEYLNIRQALTPTYVNGSCSFTLTMRYPDDFMNVLTIPRPFKGHERYMLLELVGVNGTRLVTEARTIVDEETVPGGAELYRAYMLPAVAHMYTLIVRAGHTLMVYGVDASEGAMSLTKLAIYTPCSKGLPEATPLYGGRLLLTTCMGGPRISLLTYNTKTDSYSLAWSYVLPAPLVKARLVKPPGAPGLVLVALTEDGSIHLLGYINRTVPLIPMLRFSTSLGFKPSWSGGAETFWVNNGLTVLGLARGSDALLIYNLNKAAKKIMEDYLKLHRLLDPDGIYLNLTMYRAGSLKVVVRDEAGRPLRGALVTISGPRGASVPVTLSAETGADGVAVFTNIPYGVYNVTITPPNPNMYPKTLPRITVRPGGEAQLTVKLRYRRFPLLISLRDEFGKNLLTNVTVVVEAISSPLPGTYNITFYANITKAELMLPPGNYSVSAEPLNPYYEPVNETVLLDWLHPNATVRMIMVRYRGSITASIEAPKGVMEGVNTTITLVSRELGIRRSANLTGAASVVFSKLPYSNYTVCIRGVIVDQPCVNVTLREPEEKVVFKPLLGSLELKFTSKRLDVLKKIPLTVNVTGPVYHYVTVLTKPLEGLTLSNLRYGNYTVCYTAPLIVPECVRVAIDKPSTLLLLNVSVRRFRLDIRVFDELGSRLLQPLRVTIQDSFGVTRFRAEVNATHPNTTAILPYGNYKIDIEPATQPPLYMPYTAYIVLAENTTIDAYLKRGTGVLRVELLAPVELVKKIPVDVNITGPAGLHISRRLTETSFSLAGLVYGTYHICAESPVLQRNCIRVEHHSTTTTAWITLKPKTFPVSVSLVEASAKAPIIVPLLVLVDGSPKASVPGGAHNFTVTFELPAGKHYIEVRPAKMLVDKLTGIPVEPYYPLEKTVEVTGPTRITLILERGFIEVTLLLRDAYTGTPPKTPVDMTVSTGNFTVYVHLKPGTGQVTLLLPRAKTIKIEFTSSLYTRKTIVIPGTVYRYKVSVRLARKLVTFNLDVVNDLGQPLPQALVYISGINVIYETRLFTTAKGELRVSLPIGTYRVCASKQGYMQVCDIVKVTRETSYVLRLKPLLITKIARLTPYMIAGAAIVIAVFIAWKMYRRVRVLAEEVTGEVF